ncbi:MAG TPA: DUF1722 domain-containing protein [Planctomycetaceae bacterium]|nr:DUF1722 domain-containing protein [Planctomycetaceae bacterium]
MFEPEPQLSERPIRIGVSSCLLGHHVRFDGGHKRDHFVVDVLGPFVEFVPVCPEVEIGLSVPRPTLRLQRQGRRLRMVISRSGEDVTGRMRSFARARVARLARENLSGYVCKAGSPSCGMNCRTQTASGKPAPSAPGLFAAQLLHRLPDLPVAEERQLRDLRFRENWIQSVFAYHRLQQLWRSRWRTEDLVAFHTAHRFLLLAHSPQACRELDRLLARAPGMPRAQLRARYQSALMSALAKIATGDRHAEVLLRMLGLFQDRLDRSSRRDLLDEIKRYRRGQVPLIVPVSVIKHYVRVLDVKELRAEVYLNPDPEELALRNHA